MPAIELLSLEQQGLFLSLFLFGSREYETLLAFLPEKEAKIILEQMGPFAQMDRAQRMSLLVAHLKKLFALESQSVLFSVEPSWLVEILQKEEELIKNALLQSLPASLIKQVENRLEDELAFNAFLSDNAKRALLFIFESMFEPMPLGNIQKNIEIGQLVLLKPVELVQVLRETGRWIMAEIFSALGIQVTATFLRNFSELVQNEIMDGIQKIQIIKCLDDVKAKHLLEFILTDFRNTEDLFQRAGIYLVAYVLSDKTTSLRIFAQRLPYVHGQLLLQYQMAILKTPELLGEVAVLKNRLFQITIDLSKNKKIDGRFSECVIST